MIDWFFIYLFIAKLPGIKVFFFFLFIYLLIR